VSFAGYLFDEHVPRPLLGALRREDPALPPHVVGRGIAPPQGAPDPELLAWIEEHDCILVTDNRRTMAVHLRTHLAAGRHVPGVLTVRQTATDWRTVVEHRLLVWHAAGPDEFRDRIDYLPLK
jgi:hypothetical protein